MGELPETCNRPEVQLPNKIQPRNCARREPGRPIRPPPLFGLRISTQGEGHMKTITKHYIDGEFVESHGREVMEIVNPTNGKVIAHVTLADEEDARRAIAAAKRAFASFGRTTKEERMEILRRLHKAVSARTKDLTKVMVEEYGGVVQFAGLISQAGGEVFLAAEKALDELPLTRSWG